MKYVVIMNGRPLSGKDTMVDFCKNHILHKLENGKVIHDSSINPIKEICTLLGWKGEKTDYWRKVMSDLKKIWVESCNGPTQYLLNQILNDNICSTNENTWFFFDIREADEIDKLVKILNQLSIFDIKCKTILVNRGHEDHGNDSDDCVWNYHYHHVIDNTGSKNDLKEIAEEFVNKLIKEEEK